uniref:Uncharacterized protein n=1 Tax=Ganoderma boninense TaxID=34458 RepID=A0A5K1JVL4_9APHY|nr:Uncharacterized protein [Ganoderma boninense]
MTDYRALPRRALEGEAKNIRDGQYHYRIWYSITLALAEAVGSNPALYANGGRFPTRAEKLSAFEKIVAQAPWYSWHRHLSWCSGKEQRARRRACQGPGESRRVHSDSTSAMAAAQALAAQTDLQRAMAYAAPRPWWCFYYPQFTMLEIGEWACEASVSVGTMAEAVHQLALHKGFLAEMHFASLVMIQ